MNTKKRRHHLGEGIRCLRFLRQIGFVPLASVLFGLGVCIAAEQPMGSVADVVKSDPDLLTAIVQTPPPADTGYFKMGTSRNPDGREISVNSQSLLLNGKPWFPVMGEFHYTRVPQAEWHAELQKMKAGGIDIVSTYVFWIHHQEINGQWDWTGRRDLRQFLQTCGEVGLKVLVRCGPWCHGEVRNGGLPDWVVAHKDWKVRTTDANFLAAVKVLYGQIADQMRGELWKDGGPVIGIQVDNEYRGSPDYLMALKEIAIASGIDVPLYTKTGWPTMRRPVPLGELLPFFGTYADGFWERSLTPMNGAAWENFAFKKVRTDTGIGNDTLGNRKAGDTAGTQKYPYLTCEIGGGMETSYHRRMNLDPRDVEAVALCQLGSGSALMGYYMYHGGQNPDGKLTTLQESTETGYPNDLPVKNYDFNAPIGEYGQLNPQYYWLRRLHLFLHDFGGSLAEMPATLPNVRPTNRDDLATLRWSVRSDGMVGFVFVNNYQRLQVLPPKANVQFKLILPGGELTFPQKPVTIPAGGFFFWPFNLDIAGARLIYSTAQPVCKADQGGSEIDYFAKTPGVDAQFVFDPKTLESKRSVFKSVRPDRKPAIQLRTASGKNIQIVLLSDADSLALQKLNGNVFFQRPPDISSVDVHVTLIRPASPVREIRFDPKSHLATAPTDADFTNAAVWKISLPQNLDLRANLLLRIRYVGDVARLTLDGNLLDDDFYSGRTFDIGLKRYAPEIRDGDLRLEILPLRKDAPIYFEPGVRPAFDFANAVVNLKSVVIINQPG